MAIPGWVREGMEAIDANWRFTRQVGMGSRVGPEGQVGVEVTAFDSTGNPVEAVVDGEMVMGEENILRTWAMGMLRRVGMDVDSPREWRRVNRKRRPIVIGG